MKTLKERYMAREKERVEENDARTEFDVGEWEGGQLQTAYTIRDSCSSHSTSHVERLDHQEVRSRNFGVAKTFHSLPARFGRVNKLSRRNCRLELA
ncbi:hypothetical protein VTI28DRAFT_3707 [Corynascus sepedonium]